MSTTRTLAATLAIASFVSFSSAAMAAEPEATADDRALQGKKGDVKSYVFEDDTIGGEVLRPEGANIASRGKNKAASLISIRATFIEQLIKLADDI
jgi:hypothetical protein